MRIINTMLILMATLPVPAFGVYEFPDWNCWRQLEGPIRNPNNCAAPTPVFPDQFNSYIEVNGCPVIADSTLHFGLNGSPEYVKMTLTAPSGASIVVMDSPDSSGNCQVEGWAQWLLDSDALDSIQDNAGCFEFNFKRPKDPLSAFNGQSGNDTWTLTVQESVHPLQGRAGLSDWSIDLACQASEVISCDGFESCQTP